MTGVGDRIGGYPAVAAGQEELVSFDDAGGKTVYYESTCFECEDGRGAAAPGLEVTSEDGDTLEVGDYATDGNATPGYTDGPFSYTRGGFDGAPVYTFRIPEPGSYRVRMGESPAPDAQMRLGPSVVRGWFSGLLLMIGGVIVGGVLLAAGVVVLVVAGVRRRRWRRQATQGPWPPPGPGWGPPPASPLPHSAAPTRPGPHTDPPASTPPGMEREWPLPAIPIGLWASPELSGP